MAPRRDQKRLASPLVDTFISSTRQPLVPSLDVVDHAYPAIYSKLIVMITSSIRTRTTGVDDAATILAVLAAQCSLVAYSQI